MVQSILTEKSDPFEVAKDLVESWQRDTQRDGRDAATEKLIYIIATYIRDRLKPVFENGKKTSLYFEFDPASEGVSGFIEIKNPEQLLKIIETMVRKEELAGILDFAMRGAERETLMLGLSAALGFGRKF